MPSVNSTNTLFNTQYIELDIEAYRANLSAIMKRIHPAPLCAVLKSNAYGHGIRQLAPVADRLGVGCIGVCDNLEIVAVRKLGISKPIIRLRPATVDEIIRVISFNAIETIGSLESAIALNAALNTISQYLTVHIEVDCGIGRSGIQVSSIESVNQILQLSNIKVSGFYAHCSSVKSMWNEFNSFKQLKDTITQLLPDQKYQFHFGNSDFALLCSEFTAKDIMFRSGIATFGCFKYTGNDYSTDPLPTFFPVMNFSVPLALIRVLPKNTPIGYNSLYRTKEETIVGTIPVGYSSGYFRAVNEHTNGWVLIRGKRCPLVGRISMNMMTVDLTELSKEENMILGEKVTLLGRQGAEVITCDEIAEWANTNAYEVMCSIGNVQSLSVNSLK